MRLKLSLLLVAGTLAWNVGAQPAQPPTTPPPAPRDVLVMPEGFEKVSAGGHTAICAPADADWVKTALNDVKPATRPTTMPADLLKRLADGRAGVIRQMVADLALPDDKAAVALFDEQLRPTLQKLEALKPPVFFLICTRARLREVVKAGWGEPRFHYNRLADEVGFLQDVKLAVDGPMDDAVLPGFYNDTDAPAVRAKELAAGLAQFDANIAGKIAQDAELAVNNMIAEHIGKTYFEPLKLGRDQQWLTLGATGYFAAKYAAGLTARPLNQWLDAMTLENPRYLLSARPIDLVKPIEESTMRKEAAPFYLQAMRRKGTAAVRAWVERGGEASVSKVLAAVRTAAPADGAALVKLIREVGGVDLSKELGPQ